MSFQVYVNLKKNEFQNALNTSNSDLQLRPKRDEPIRGLIDIGKDLTLKLRFSALIVRKVPTDL